MTYGYQMDGFLKTADYKHWNNIAFVTLNEFTYLAAGFYPLLAGQYSLAYLDLSDKKFKQFYEEIKRLGEDDLPLKTNEETEIKDCMSAEPKDEAVFLIKWAKSKELCCCPSYQPIMIVERKKMELVNAVRGLESLPLVIFARLLASFNKSVGDEAHFERLLIGAENAGKIRSLISSRTTPTVEADPPSIDYEITALITWAQQKKFIVPEEIIPNIVCNDDNINPKRLKSLQTMILAISSGITSRETA
ncbi:MAG: hypothetical protein NTW94_00380 [Legionellales bacterium]|nr:hypothetical protein [Legionellales bacterium]